MQLENLYPISYRSKETRQILNAISSGDSVLLIGLSGSGKSNLIKYLTLTQNHSSNFQFFLIDCNNLQEPGAFGLFNLIRKSIGEIDFFGDYFEKIIDKIACEIKKSNKKICLVFDRFEIIQEGSDQDKIYNQLRYLRDLFKYNLIYLISTRYPFSTDNEISELFYANTIWLGPLNEADTFWNIKRYMRRKNVEWSDEVIKALSDLSAGYPSFLRGVCESYFNLNSLNPDQLISHPAVQSRLREFLLDNPSIEAIENSQLSHHPLLNDGSIHAIDTNKLTLKENKLLNLFLSNPSKVFEKDELIQAVWTEDVVFQKGIRDDNLAQLIRRLRKKIEPSPSKPSYIQTIPGRGYIYYSKPQNNK
ncbi:MAG: winged helix-turn-helix domain-containing protein [Anaerolineaceae bacterium]|nr:winged helix-turn-helix domain-containing protein [Anaerolineaceae bacterium]